MKATYRYNLAGLELIVQHRQVAANQTITKGDFLVYSGGKVAKAGVAFDASIFAGVAEGAITTGAQVTAAQTIPVNITPKAVYEVSYTAGSKTSLAQTDCFGTRFDIDATTQLLLLDDTTGGSLVVLDFNNTADTAHVMVAKALSVAPVGVAAAGAAPDKAEFDAVVVLVNELKAQLNKLGISNN